MRARVEDDLLFVHKDDLPHYKKNGSVVRNSYFWALRAIAAYSPFDRDWEFDQVVWVALQRLLLTFAESGYLGLQETTLEFPTGVAVPEGLQLVSTWVESPPEEP